MDRKADEMMLADVRTAIARLGVDLEGQGLLSGTAGNISARVGERVVITPSGMPYAEIGGADVTVVDLAGVVVEGARRPSSELFLHLGAYLARPDVGAVVHAHSPFATVLAVLGWALPAAHYGIAELDTDEVPIVPYATFGTAALADSVRAALAGGTRAVLLANHGAVAIGRDLAAAADAARLLESLAHTYYHARVVGDPVILSAAEIAAVRDRFRTHGQHAS